MEKTKDKVSCAYKEIYEILKIFPKELVDRIPKYKLDYIKQNMDESYEYNITKETFDGKTMLDETAAILAILFRDYWATEKQKNKIVAIGEIGLDYYWEKDEKMRELQRKAFIKQIELANKLNLPIVIHTREAIMDTLEILKQNPVDKKGVFHCCPQNRELIKEGLKLGFYISFAGPITFKSSKNAEEMINLVPDNRILIETDSPYLAPEPVRGTRNDCRNVKYIAEKIAKAKNISLEEVSKITMQNVRELFNI